MKAAKYLPIVIFAILCLMSFVAKADNGKKTFILSPSLEINQTETGKLQIKTNFVVSVSNTNFEIQRSYDNKNFQSVAIIVGDAEAGCFQPFKITDYVKSNNSKIFYRIVKTTQSSSTIILKTWVEVK